MFLQQKRTPAVYYTNAGTAGSSRAWHQLNSTRSRAAARDGRNHHGKRGERDEMREGGKRRFGRQDDEEEAAEGECHDAAGRRGMRPPALSRAINGDELLQLRRQLHMTDVCRQKPSMTSTWCVGNGASAP